MKTESKTNQQAEEQTFEVIEMIAMALANIIERLERIEALTDGGDIRNYDID